MSRPPIVAEELVRVALEQNEGGGLVDVRLGLGYTGVVLEDGHAGLAYTFRDEAGHGCSVFHGLRPLAERSPSDLVSFLPSEDRIEAAVGLACTNALLNRDGPGLREGDILGQLDLRPNDRVGMVGYFGPVVRGLEGRVSALTVFERADLPEPGVRPAEEAVETLPECQVALLTATSIINHTIDALLNAASGCREVVILGASTPLVSEVFKNRGVTMLSGVVVRDAEGILRVISEGGGMRYFGPHIRKVSLRIRG
jgi:uncharacterized protein (DUF4213/DUF364 family)